MPVLVSRTLTNDDLIGEQRGGTTRRVDPVNGDARNDGGSWDTAMLTLQGAIDASVTGDTILVRGRTVENATIPRGVDNLTIRSYGGKGVADIVADTDGVALTNKADGTTLVNLDLEGDGTGGALVNTGARLRAIGCKIEAGAEALALNVGSDADITADLDGKGADCEFINCEFAWSDDFLVVFRGSDYGAVTQILFDHCRFHNGADVYVGEATGAGGSVGVRFRNILFRDCVMEPLEDGSDPATAYVSLDADNANTGTFASCSFPEAINGGLVLGGTGVVFDNQCAFTGTQPS